MYKRSGPVLGLAALASVVALSGTASAPANAQKKKPAPKKPPVAAKKPAPKPTGPVVLGTTQLSGDFGQLGTTYTIGKSSPLNFTLRSAEYSAVPVSFADSTYLPGAAEKVLVLRFTVQNPNKEETFYNWAGIHFTAVDATDTNREYVQAVSREGETTPFGVSLKPAQKVDLVTAIVVPAKGVVPKLIVLREEGAPVIRYDLRGKVKPLPAIYADPSDSTGATVRSEIAAEPGTYYPLGKFAWKVESMKYVSGPVEDIEAEEGKRLLAVTLTAKNNTLEDQYFNWSSVTATVTDSDGEKNPAVQTLKKASRDEDASGNLRAGEEARVRLLFQLPQSASAKTLWLAEGEEARVFVFPVSVTP